jgi:hypothetical protein
MPKNSSLDVLKRLQALDKALLTGVVFVKKFAQKWDVTTRQVRYDLGTLRDLGQLIVPFVYHEEGEDRIQAWQYAPDQRPLFLESRLAGGKENVEVFKRWRDLDKALADGWLFVRKFAEKRNVTTQTVATDLKNFRELGQAIESWWEYLGDLDCKVKLWRYAPGTGRLFTDPPARKK